MIEPPPGSEVPGKYAGAPPLPHLTHRKSEVRETEPETRPIQWLGDTLSLVLSVFMYVSCFVFYPKAMRAHASNRGDELLVVCGVLFMLGGSLLTLFIYRMTQRLKPREEKEKSR